MTNCDECGKKMWTATGQWNGNRRWCVCRNCGSWKMEAPQQGLRLPPKVLYVDVEISLTELLVKTFNMEVKSGWLDWHNITKSFYIISWAAAWVDDNPIKVKSDAVTGKEALRGNDKRMLGELWNMMELADYVCGHNVQGFDTKKIQTRFLLNNMGSPSSFIQRDTLTMAKKYFKPESQALDYWMRLLGGQAKDHMVKEDWEEVNKGNEKIIRKMKKYNVGDVEAGVDLLKRFRKHIESNGKDVLFK